MQNAWLIVWLPLIGFLFNALSGLVVKEEQTQKRIVSWVAPGVVLLAFGVAFGIFMQGVHERTFVPLLPWDNPQNLTPWIKMGLFEVKFGLLIDPLSMLMALIVTGVGGLIHV